MDELIQRVINEEGNNLQIDDERDNYFGVFCKNFVYKLKTEGIIEKTCYGLVIIKRLIELLKAIRNLDNLSN